MLTTESKKVIISEFGGAATDTGAAQVQIALLTARIRDLQKHFDVNPKDHSSRRGLLKMVGARRRLLKYIKTNDVNKYRDLILKLELRK